MDGLQGQTTVVGCGPHYIARLLLQQKIQTIQLLQWDVWTTCPICFYGRSSRLHSKFAVVQTPQPDSIHMGTSGLLVIGSGPGYVTRKHSQTCTIHGPDYTARPHRQTEVLGRGPGQTAVIGGSLKSPPQIQQMELHSLSDADK